MLLHASCVAFDGQGVLLTGPSGVGKSDVALRLIDSGCVLVSDDQTQLKMKEGQLMASPPDALAGLIELRHVGLVQLPFCAAVPVALYVELVGDEEVLERLPVPTFHSLLDHPVRVLKLPARVASTPAKIRLVMQGTLQDV